MTGYGMKNRGSIPDRDRNLTPTSRPALGPIQQISKGYRQLVPL